MGAAREQLVKIFEALGDAHPDTVEGRQKMASVLFALALAIMNAIDLPASIPVFPLSGVLLLPRGRLPLNIFEPRYRNMTQDALSGDGIIGMVQPVLTEEVPVTPEGQIKNLDGERLVLYSTGCAGRIVSHEDHPMADS